MAPTTKGAPARARPVPDGQQPGTGALVDIQAVAGMLGVSVRFVRRLVNERRIPFYKVGKFVRLNTGEVAEWVRSKRVEQQ